jgi:hypothetical protein
MKFLHPLFESAVAGINILDMVNVSNDSNAGRGWRGDVLFQGYKSQVGRRQRKLPCQVDSSL